MRRPRFERAQIIEGSIDERLRYQSLQHVRFHELHIGCDDQSTPATAKNNESKKTSTANGEHHMTHCTMRSGHHCICRNESTIAANEHPAVAAANCISFNRTARRRHQHRRVDTKHQTGICNPTSMQPLSHYLRTPRLCRRLL